MAMRGMVRRCLSCCRILTRGLLLPSLLRTFTAFRELLLHIEVWDEATLRRLAGEVCQPEGEANFPPLHEQTDAAWRKAISRAKQTHNTLVKTVAALSTRASAIRFPEKITTSIICYTELYSTSCTTRGRLPF